MYAQIIEKLKEYLNEEEIKMFEKCYNDSTKEYRDKLFLDKINTLEYINNVILTLTNYHVAIESLLSCLLLKTDNINYSYITNEYGEDTYTMLEALVKIDNDKEKTNYTIDNENYRKIFVALAKDYNVLIIRLVMQQELMKYLDLFDEEFQQKVAKETLDVYSPIAHRLGMHKIKTYLENTSIYYLERERYLYIQNMLKQRSEERQNKVDNMIEKIKKLLHEHNIPYYSIKGRPKEIYSIYKKMVNKNLEFDELYDLLALRVITETDVNCYEILGYIHAVYKPISGRFKDYIAVPKRNMYQSLHTSIVADDGNIYEIQIRTKKMDEWAESGVAAHWKYKEGDKGNKEEIEEKLHFFREFIEANEDTKDKEEYVENLKKEVFESSIYVMSPRGKVVELPVGACPIDFAYRIHSNVGHSCVGALVNGVMVPINTELKTGDIVEIKTSKLHTAPSEGWLQIVKTSNAQNYIRKALQKKNAAENKEELIQRGESLLLEEARNRNVSEKDIDEVFEDISFLQQFGVNKVEDLYLVIANRAVNPINVIEKVKAKKTANSVPTFEFKKRNIKAANSEGILVKGIDTIKVELSQCCCPIPGDPIIGYISRGKGVKVHRTNCPTLKNLSPRFIDVEWDPSVIDNVLHQVDLIIRAGNRNNLLVEIMNTLSTLKITPLELNAVTHKENLNASVHLSIMVKDGEHYQSVENSLRNIKGVFEVERTARN